MKRIPEPELMDDASQARAYAEADFSEPNQQFLDLFTSHFPAFDAGLVIDLGCGPADICAEFALRYPRARVIGVDGARAMLDFGIARIEQSGVAGQVELKCLYLEPGAVGRICEPGNADAVISNSLLHHLATPQTLWQALNRLGHKGTKILVMDLARPDDLTRARQIVTQYAADEPAILQRDFYNSLLAAYTVEEVRAQLDDNGLSALDVRMCSDRHLLVSGVLE